MFCVADSLRPGAGPGRRARRRWAGLCAALLLSIPSASRADMLWGANGHPLTAYPGLTIARQLDLLADAGLRAYRVDVTSLDQMDHLRELIGAAKARNIQILPVLLPRVDLKEGTEQALYAQARQFARIMAAEFGSDVKVWELGNELETFAIIQPCEMRSDGTQYPCQWGPAGGVGPGEYFGPRVRKVIAVLRGLSDGVADKAPGARRAIGSAGWGHLGIFDLLRDNDVAWEVSVWHIYGEDPEWAFKHLQTFGKPIWVTEFNNLSGSSNGGEAGQARGLAAMMARLRQLSAAYGVEASFVYELCDETYWAPSSEATMGLVRLEKSADGSWQVGGPKEAFEVVRQQTGQTEQTSR